jgi:hypothetical protein
MGCNPLQKHNGWSEATNIKQKAISGCLMSSLCGHGVGTMATIKCYDWLRFSVLLEKLPSSVKWIVFLEENSEVDLDAFENMISKYR